MKDEGKTKEQLIGDLKALPDSEEYFRSLIENSLDLIALLDADGTIRYASPSHKQVLGYEPEDLTGKNAFELVHSEDLPNVINAIAHGIQIPGHTTSLECRFRHKDGSWRIIEGVGKNLLDHPVVAGIIVNSRDITERKRAEEMLRRQALMFENAYDGIILTDMGGRILDWNPGAERMFGYGKEEALGKTPGIIHRPEESGVLTGQIMEGIRREGRWAGEIHYLHKDGREGVCETVIVALRGGNGEPVVTIGINRDITERKEVERLKDKLVSTVSHELRTPLSSLCGFTELMLKGDYPPEKQRDFLIIIHNEAVRLTTVINNCLDLQRMESGRQIYNFDSVEIGLLIRESVAVFSPEDGKHTLHLEVPDILPLVRADAGRIRQVLSNLLSNAVKYSPQGGEIRMRARQEGTEVVVWVKDQGVGIPSEALPKVFDKFFRVDNTDTRSIGGTGLGLALVKEIVEAHEGRVWVEIEVGEGSTFFFTLPVA